MEKANIHEKEPIICLGVDEFMRFEPENYEKAMNFLKDFLESKNFNCKLLISTLDSGKVIKSLGLNVRQAKTTSSRKIFWVKLPLLLDKPFLLNFFKKKFPSFSEKWIEFFLSLCNGHARTVEALLDVFYVSDPQSSFSHLFKLFEGNLPKRNLSIVDSEVIQLLKGILAQSVLGMKVKLDHKIPGTTKTYRESNGSK